MKTHRKIYTRCRRIAGILLCLSAQTLLAISLFSSPAVGAEKTTPEEQYNRAFQLLLATRVEEDTLNADTPPRCESIDFNTYLYPKYERALGEFLQFQQQHPNHASADDALYYAYLILKKMPPEVLHDKGWLAKYPDNPSFLLVKLEKSYPTSPLMEEVYYERGKANFDQGKYDEAIKDLQRLVKSYPTSRYLPVIKYCIAVIYKEKKDYAKVLPAFKKLKVESRQHKRLGDIEYAIGECLYYIAKARNYQPEPLNDLKEIVTQMRGVIARHSDNSIKAKEIIWQAFQDVADLLLKNKKLEEYAKAKKSLKELLISADDDKGMQEIAKELLAQVAERVGRAYKDLGDKAFNMRTLKPQEEACSYYTKM
ncbi:MAG: tetratricopeptide repeat protein, partial [bacterium]|nr:tetratricopeptide repeat protein [bacterium]